MDDFFKGQFRNDQVVSVQDVENAPFHSLFNGVKTGGQVVVVFLSYVAVFVAMSLIVVYFFQLYTKDDKAGRSEPKQKLINGVLIFIAIIGTGWLVVTTINLFNW